MTVFGVALIAIWIKVIAVCLLNICKKDPIDIFTLLSPKFLKVISGLNPTLLNWCWDIDSTLWWVSDLLHLHENSRESCCHFLNHLVIDLSTILCWNTVYYTINRHNFNLDSIGFPRVPDCLIKGVDGCNEVISLCIGCVVVCWWLRNFVSGNLFN
jgi:hypothetical protein